MSSSFKRKPHFIDGAKYPLTTDAVATPPVPCDFNIGERVTFTNDNGVEFRDQLITGFSPEVMNGRFVYLDFDCWWFAVKPSNLSRSAACTSNSSH